MGQLIGEFSHSMDAKGRVKLPSVWEPELGGKFMVTRGTGPMLFIFSMPQWEIFCQKLAELPMMDPSAQALRRIFGAGARECEVDKQGRFLIPQKLREHAHLEKETVLAGAFTWGEIWNAQAWEEYNDQYADTAGEDFMQLMSTVTQKFSL